MLYSYADSISFLSYSYADFIRFLSYSYADSNFILLYIYADSIHIILDESSTYTLYMDEIKVINLVIKCNFIQNWYS